MSLPLRIPPALLFGPLVTAVCSVLHPPAMLRRASHTHICYFSSSLDRVSLCSPGTQSFVSFYMFHYMYSFTVCALLHGLEGTVQESGVYFHCVVSEIKHGSSGAADSLVNCSCGFYVYLPRVSIFPMPFVGLWYSIIPNTIFKTF